jgi:group I intron endonuclease
MLEGLTTNKILLYNICILYRRHSLNNNVNYWIINFYVHVIIGSELKLVFFQFVCEWILNSSIIKAQFSTYAITKLNNKSINLFNAPVTNKRFYTITSCCLAGKSKSDDFWRKVNSKKVNEMNPHYLVEKFFKDYPNQEFAKKNLSYDLVLKIMKLHNSDFFMSTEEFDILKNIQSFRLSYPFDISLPEQVGKSLIHGKGASGVYLFTNKINGERYLGSSINLASRLKNGYFGNLPLIGQRKIERAIREYGLSNFYLDIYLLPSSVKSTTNSLESSILVKDTLRFLVLALEQMLIMELNPELNEIKVAGSSPGILTSKNLRNSYLYDGVNKQLIYIVNGRKNLANILGCNENAIKRYLAPKNKLYLKRFFIADDILNNPEYTINFMSLSELEDCIRDIRLGRKSYLTKVVPSREETYLKFSKKVELTNLVTKEVLIFDSLTKVAQFSFFFLICSIFILQ